jgi:hypothetical protein
MKTDKITAKEVYTDLVRIEDTEEEDLPKCEYGTE